MSLSIEQRLEIQSNVRIIENLIKGRQMSTFDIRLESIVIGTNEAVMTALKVLINEGKIRQVRRGLYESAMES